MQRLKKELSETECRGQDELNTLQIGIQESQHRKLTEIEKLKKDNATLQDVIERLNVDLAQLQSQVKFEYQHLLCHCLGLLQLRHAKPFQISVSTPSCPPP